MREIIIRVILSCVFLVLVTPAFAADTIGGPTVTLDQAIHFFATDGSDVVVGPGTYLVEATEEWLRVIPGERRDALLLEAQSTAHEEMVADPIARLIPGEEDQYSLILLLPDGRAMEAIGSISGVRSRAVNRTRVARASKLRQKFSRLPAQTKKASTLKKTKPYKRQSSGQNQGGAPSSGETLEQRVQTLEQQVTSLLSVIQITQGGAIIQAQNLSLESQNLTIETHGGNNGLTINSDTNITINAALKLTAQSGTDLKLKGGLHAKLEGGVGVTVKGGAQVKVEGGSQLNLKGPIVYLGSGSGMKRLALVGSGVVTAIGGGPGTVVTGSATVFAK